MRKVVAILIAVILPITLFISCGKKSDEELIEARINHFVTAYNTGDMDEVINCMDALSRNTLKGILGLSSSILGGLGGFDLNLSDLFGVSVGLLGGDLMKVEIQEITLTDETHATVTVTMNLDFGYTEEASGAAYFSMVKEEDDWFIHDFIVD